MGKLEKKIKLFKILIFFLCIDLVFSTLFFLNPSLLKNLKKETIIFSILADIFLILILFLVKGQYEKKLYQIRKN